MQPSVKAPLESQSRTSIQQSLEPAAHGPAGAARPAPAGPRREQDACACALQRNTPRGGARPGARAQRRRRARCRPGWPAAARPGGPPGPRPAAAPPARPARRPPLPRQRRALTHAGRQARQRCTAGPPGAGAWPCSWGRSTQRRLKSGTLMLIGIVMHVRVSGLAWPPPLRILPCVQVVMVTHQRGASR